MINYGFKIGEKVHIIDTEHIGKIEHVDIETQEIEVSGYGRGVYKIEELELLDNQPVYFMNNGKITKLLNGAEIKEKVHNENQIDFEKAISKKQQSDNKKVETFNSVIKDNIEGIKKLFKTDCSEFILRTSIDKNGYLELTLKKTMLPEDKVYEFGYIEGRGDNHAIKEDTMNRLKNFITNIYCENKI